MEHQFEKKKVIVTGAGKGLGRAICLHLAKLKARVLAISRTQSDLDSLKEEDSSIEVYRADVAEWNVIDKLLVDIGPVDFLVNNAGVTVRKPILEVSKEELDNVTDINYKAAFHVSQVVARQMIEHNIEGTIVNISSISGQRAISDLSTYCVSKAALDAMTKAFALELGPHKIRVNGLSPGYVSSGMVRNIPSERVDAIRLAMPLRRVVDEEDVIKAVLYLLSENSSMVTGVNLILDGGHILSLL